MPCVQLLLSLYNKIVRKRVLLRLNLQFHGKLRPPTKTNKSTVRLKLRIFKIEFLFVWEICILFIGTQDTFWLDI